MRACSSTNKEMAGRDSVQTSWRKRMILFRRRCVSTPCLAGAGNPGTGVQWAGLTRCRQLRLRSTFVEGAGSRRGLYPSYT